MQVHRNNIGCLRLLFASLVIFGHAPEIIDGDRAREPLTMIFHTISLGDLSVDAFFVISGYLITCSMERAPSLLSYLKRRALRIYPGFVLASLVSVFGLGILLGEEPWRLLPQTIARMLFLMNPMRYPATSGHMGPALNGSMWTIIYEFRCYLLIAALGVAGLLRRPRFMAALMAVVLTASIWSTFRISDPVLSGMRHTGLFVAVFGLPDQTLRLTAAFLVGSQFYLWRDTILPRLDGVVALLSISVATLFLYRDPHFAPAAAILFGAPALFWLALKADIGPLQSINDRWDISYGVYLYGWPSALVLVTIFRGLTPVTLALASLALASTAGAASWWGLEKWAKDLVIPFPSARRPAPAAVKPLLILGADESV